MSARQPGVVMRCPHTKRDCAIPSCGGFLCMKRANAETYIATMRAQVLALAREPYRPEYGPEFVAAVDALIRAAQARG